MADLDIPPAAIAAQQAYDAADEEVHRLVELLPSGTALAAGQASIPDDLRAQVQQAREARIAALHVLIAERSKLAGNPVEVEQALRKAARETA